MEEFDIVMDDDNADEPKLVGKGYLCMSDICPFVFKTPDGRYKMIKGNVYLNFFQGKLTNTKLLIDDYADLSHKILIPFGYNIKSQNKIINEIYTEYIKKGEDE